MRRASLLLLLLTGCSDTVGLADTAGEQPNGAAFACTPERLWDGDGPIWCREGPRVRLAGIAAIELGGECRPGHPCPSVDPIASRDHLASLLGDVVGESSSGHLLIDGPPLECVSTGSAGGSRVGAWCRSPRVGDLSCRMVADGMAARWDRYWRDHQC
jgi:endonuclease YncB( thermonuclease family)